MMHELTAVQFDNIVNAPRIKRRKKATGKTTRGPLYSKEYYYPDYIAKGCTNVSETTTQPPAGGWGSLLLVRGFDADKKAFLRNSQTPPKHPDLKRNDYTPPPIDQAPIPKQRRGRKAPGKEKIVKVARFNPGVNIAPQDSYQLTKFLKLKLDAPPDVSSLYGCVMGYIPGEVTGKTYHKVVSCGKETCKTCGADYSITHNRRVNRAFQKVMQLETVGYLVVTTPAQLRNAFLNKRVLQDFRNFVRRKLKRDYNTRGLIRYHWCGDDCTTWKPHLNVLLEGKYWEPGKLEGFRKAVAKWFVEYFKLSTPVAGNIYYQYVNPLKYAPGAEREKAIRKIKHWLKYVLRATAKRVKDVQVLDTIKGYNNTGYFGTFDKVQIERDEATAILSGCDLETGEIIKWGALVKPSIFKAEFWQWCKEIVIHKEPDKPPIHYGLYVTLHQDLIPAGVQLELKPENYTFV